MQDPESERARDGGLGSMFSFADWRVLGLEGVGVGQLLKMCTGENPLTEKSGQVLYPLRNSLSFLETPALCLWGRSQVKTGLPVGQRS